jgi:hypothetical protein
MLVNSWFYSFNNKTDFQSPKNKIDKKVKSIKIFYYIWKNNKMNALKLFLLLTVFSLLSNYELSFTKISNLIIKCISL